MKLTTSTRRRLVAGSLCLVICAIAVGQVRSMDRADQALVGDEARTAVQSLVALDGLPRLGVPTTSAEFIDRTLMNPGPALLYGMHPFVRVLGTDVGAWTFALTVGLASIALAGWAATRRQGSGAGIVVVCTGFLVVQSTNPGGMTHSLNTEIVLLPIFACAVLAWVVADGDSMFLPVLALAASFVVQTFVGSAPLVALPCLVAVVGLGLRVRSGRPIPRLKLNLAATTFLTVLVWLPTLDDQLRGTANLSGLLGFSTPGRGVAGAASAVLGSLDPFTGGGGVQELDPPGRGALVMVGAIVAIAATARGRRAARRLGALVPVTISVIAASALVTFVDPPTDTATYHFFNVGIARYVLLTCVALIALSVAKERLDAIPRVGGEPVLAARVAALVATVFGLLLIVALSAVVITAPTADPRRSEEMRAVRALTRDIVDAVPAEDKVQIISRGGSAQGNVAQGIIAQLRSAGRGNAVGAFEFLADGDRVVVITGSDQARPSAGVELGRYVPTMAGSAGSYDIGSLTTWARENQPLELSPSGRENLADRVDGAATSLCVEELLDDPSKLLELPPAFVGRLFRTGELMTPAPSQDLATALADWEIRQGFTAIELPESGDWRDRFGYSNLFLSRSSCGA